MSTPIFAIYDRNIGYQPVTAFRDCLDIARFLAVVAKCFAEFRHGSRQNVVSNYRIGPDRTHELLLEHHFSGSVGEALKHLHDLRFDPGGLVVPGDSVELRLDIKLADSKGAVHRFYPPP